MKCHQWNPRESEENTAGSHRGLSWTSIHLYSRWSVNDFNALISLWLLPSKYKTFVWYLYNVGPTSQTLGRLCTNVIQMFCVCWVITRHHQVHYARLTLCWSDLHEIWLGTLRGNKRWFDVVLKLSQRRRRWTIIKTTFVNLSWLFTGEIPKADRWWDENNSYDNTLISEIPVTFFRLKLEFLV